MASHIPHPPSTLSPRSTQVQQFLTLCQDGTVEELQQKFPEYSNFLLDHNSEGEIGLSLALISKNDEMVNFLLDNGAAKGIFVRGKTPNSLFCTLPQTIKIINHATKLPPLLTDTDPNILTKLDEALCKFITLLATKKFEEAAENASKGVVVTGTDVNLTQPIAAEKTVEQKTNQVALPPSSFANGDLVMLNPSISTDVLEQKCLGVPASGQIGIVVNSTHKTMKGEAKFGEEPDWIISIGGCATNGKIGNYPTSELYYADGSKRGKFEYISESSGKLGPGVKVILTAERRNNPTTCLLKYTDNESYVGEIVKEFPGYDAWYLKNTDPRYKGDHNEEFSLYSSSMIIFNASKKIEVGDRVLLHEDAPKDKSWCLSPDISSNQKLGVVLFVPPGDQDQSSEIENQRLIYVAPIDESNPFQLSEDHKVHSTWNLYKSSWLKRAQPVGSEIYQSADNVGSSFSHYFKPGDRVQLNHGTWNPNSPATAGKCLGTPSQNLYGIVRSVGRTTDGVQRNIEVIVVLSDQTRDTWYSIIEPKLPSISTLISLYPSYSLVPANFFSVLHDSNEEHDLLEKALQEMISPTGLKFDLKSGITKLGLRMWSELFAPMQRTIGVEALLDHFDRWQKQRYDLYKDRGGWDIDLENTVKARINSEFNLRKELNEQLNYGIVEDQVVQENLSSETPLIWRCLSCGYSENSTAMAACFSCKAKASAWKCFCCTSVNRLWNSYCLSCKGSRERSKLISKAHKESLVGEETINNPQLFLPSYFHVIYECCVIQASRNPFNESRTSLALSQLSNSSLNLKIFPKRHLDETIRFHLRRIDGTTFLEDFCIIWGRPSDSIDDLRQRIESDLHHHVKEVQIFKDFQKVDEMTSLVEFKSVFEVGSRVLVDYDNIPTLKIATIEKNSRDHFYNLLCDDGIKLTEVEENRLRPVISMSDMKNPPTIVEGMVVYLNSKGLGSVNRAVVKMIKTQIDPNDGPQSETKTNDVKPKYDLEIFGSSAIEDSVEQDWIYFPRGSFLNDAPLESSVTCKSTGHAVLVLKRSSGGNWYCDKCSKSGNKSYSWYCKICDCDYCFNCVPHHSIREASVVEVLSDSGIWRLAIVKKAEGPVDVRYLDGTEEVGIELPRIRVPEFLQYQCSENIHLLPQEFMVSIDSDVPLVEVKSVQVAADEDLVELEDFTESANNSLPQTKESPPPKFSLPDDFEELTNDKRCEYFAEILKLKQIRLSGNKKKLFRAIRAIQYFKVGLTFSDFRDIDELVNSKDRGGNTALHHLFYLGLLQSADALFRNGASRWCLNQLSIPPLAISEGLATLYSNLSSGELSDNVMLQKDSYVRDKWSKNQLQLYKCLRKANLFPPHIMKAIFRTPDSFSPSDNLSDLIESLINMQTDDALFYAEDAIARYEESVNTAKVTSPRHHRNAAVSYSYRHSYVYKALALLDAGYGARAAQNELDSYLKSFPVDDDFQTVHEFDPITLFVIYMIWKENGQDKRKSARMRAAYALSSFRCFPAVAAEWLTDEDNLDHKVKEEGLINDNDEGDDFIDQEEDDPESDDDDYAGPIDSSSPEYQWELAKKNHGVESESMDKLMNLTGMREVKLRAVTVCKEVLLAKNRPAHIKSTVSMNFLFVGNPGTGKTTVANLLSAAMVELGYRKNKTPIMTSANEILAEQDPMQYFAGLVSQGDNGTIFIDEAYNFNPAPAGQTANPSNKVLDHLMMVSETKRETMSFILAGYKDEIQKLLTYNPGFPSRFPKDFTFEFPDYTESQLRKILKGMVKERGMRLQPIKECGVSLSKIAAQRLAKGRGKKGFGNAREVRVKLEACIVQQMDRLGALALHGKPITDRDYATLTRSDVLGDRPNFPTSAAFQELDAMIGLTKVKESLRSLMNLQLQNYDCEMRGEKVQHISLHRVFLGNAGTGKTTVARIYGRLLKDFGFLSDGDIIEVKPSDLIGSAVGESSVKTAAILESAKGKVLFIDEAYGLDPSRSTSYGGQVIDTLVERIDGNAGVDMAVILAGYEPQMKALFKNANNQGFTRRFNLDEAFEFEDFSDNDLKKVLLSLLRKENLRAGLSTVNLAVSLISQRRRLDGFGNAAECSTILDRAKLHLASRKQKAADMKEKRQRMLMNLESGVTSSSNSHKRGGAKLKSSSHDEEKNGDEGDDPENQIPSEADCVCDPYLLIDSDFVKVETSAKNARDAFSDLENMEHVMELLQDMEDTLNQAKKDGLSAAKILEDCHMIFTGPPGTGKTTVAQRFGTMFRQLELLPTDHVEIVTAANLISRYVGNTGPNVVEAMRKAKGGILFVDEAYGMVPKGGSASFGAEAIQAFIDNVTLPEFLGNIIIIFAGYQDDVEQLFGVNPGFRSRFDKRRLVFPSWTPEMATRATIKSAERDHGYGISDEGKEVLLDLYRQLSELPDWGSAREVYKVILPAMYSKRARRLAKKQRLENIVIEENKEIEKPKKPAPTNRRAQAKAKEAKSDIPPYEASDIREAFADPIKYRGGDAWNEMLKTGKLNSKPKPSTNAASSSGVSGGAESGKIDRDDGPVSASQTDDEIFTPVISTLTTTVDLQREVQSSQKDRVLLVVSFTASWVTESFELPDFAIKYKKVRFSVVSHSDETRPLFDECGVKEMRVFLLYMNGKMVERVLDKFSLMCLRIGYWMKKQTSDVLFGDSGMTLNADGPQQETHHHKTVEKKKEKVLTKKVGEGDESKDIWSALEEACKELGYSLETIKDFLESGDYPEELLRLIMRKVKSDDTSSIVEMLNSQRGAVLEKIKHAIAEIKRKKTAEEQAKLDKAKKIGKCPMDFEWIKVDGGYRCAGGSHFVTDAEVNTL